MSRPIYNKAPITEAVIDIRFEQSDDFNFQVFEKLKEILKADYPSVKKQVENEFKIEMGENPSASTVTKEQGWRLTSSDNKYVLQTKVSGFTLSRLQPYERWEPFRDEAKRLWKIFVDIVKPIKVVRTAVRFLNRIDLPGPSVELRDYFTIFPQVPPSYDINHTVLQLIVPQNDIESKLLLNQALVPPVKEDCVSIILDLDLFSESPRLIDENLWKFFEILHERKNKIFEETITDKLRELIK